MPSVKVSGWNSHHLLVISYLCVKLSSLLMRNTQFNNNRSLISVTRNSMFTFFFSLRVIFLLRSCSQSFCLSSSFSSSSSRFDTQITLTCMTAFYFLLKKPLKEVESPSHSSYEKSWMELFRMTLGTWNYPELRSSYHHWLTQIFFVLFLILVPILLLNMLIAMMGNTYSAISEKSEREFALQSANILVEIERGLSKKQASQFVDQYSLVSKDPENPKTTLMVRSDS